MRVNGLVAGLRSQGIELVSLNVLSSSRESFQSENRGYLRSAQNHVPSIVLFSLMGNVSWFLARRLKEKIKEIKPDVIQAEQEIAALVSSHLRKSLEIPFVIDYHGVWAEELIAGGNLKRGSQSHKKLIKLEQNIVKCSQAVSTVSEEMRDFVIEVYGATPAKTYVVPNAAIVKEKDSRLLDSVKNQVIYSGTVTFKENIPLFIDAVTRVNETNPSAKIFITDRGDAITKVKQTLSERKVNANYFWISEKSQFYDFLCTFNAGVIPAAKHKWRLMATPAKLYDYLSAGVPVVSTEIGASWNSIIKENKVGILTDSSPKDFADAISSFLNDPQMVIEYGNRCFRLVREKLNYDQSALVLANIYKKILG